MPRLRFASLLPRRIRVLRPSFSTLPRRLPRIVGVAELSLRKLVEPFLFAAEQIELMLTLIGVDLRRVGGWPVPGGMGATAEQSS